MSSVLAFDSAEAANAERATPVPLSVISGKPAPSESGFFVSLDFFSGPMDLLLHLVHQQEVDVSQVSMKLIAEQYLELVSRAKFLDLEKASEYLVIAATLLSIKSASLLPNESHGEIEEIDTSSEQFYEELRARLRAYEQTKARARALIELPQLGVDVFTRVDRKALLPTPEMLAEPEEVTSLALLFGRLLKRVGGAVQSYRIRLESISVVSYMMKIVDSFGLDIEHKKNASFRNLLGRFMSNEAAATTDKRRGVIIGGFIAVLELVKRGVLEVSQSGESADIALNMKLAQFGPLDSEFDSAETEGDLRSKLVLFPTKAATAEPAEEPVEADYGLMKANTRGDF